jgi:hypothetical protein
LGEAGCGPGVEREVIENFSKGLVTSRGTAKEQEQGQGQEQSSDKDRDKDSTGESYMYGKQSYRMGSQGKKRSREEGESAVADEFALFQAFQSSENDKCLYIPVPIRYKAHRDSIILNGHSEKESEGAGRGASAVTGRRGGKKGGSSAHTETEDKATATGTATGTATATGKADSRSCALLKRGFRAFGKVVGHFILRKIASAGRDKVCSSSSRSSSSCRVGMIVMK